jgi:hypothetical protein
VAGGVKLDETDQDIRAVLGRGARRFGQDGLGFEQVGLGLVEFAVAGARPPQRHEKHPEAKCMAALEDPPRRRFGGGEDRDGVC